MLHNRMSDASLLSLTRIQDGIHNKHFVVSMLGIHMITSVENTLEQMMFSRRNLGSSGKKLVQLFPDFEGQELGKRNTSSVCHPQRQTDQKHDTIFFNCSVDLNHFTKTPPGVPPFRRIAMRPPIRTIIKCHLGTNN